MRTVSQSRLRRLEQLDKGFVDQGGRLKCVTGTLTLHERPRDEPQLRIDELHQLTGCGLITLACSVDEKSNLRRHGESVEACCPTLRKPLPRNNACFPPKATQKSVLASERKAEDAR